VENLAWYCVHFLVIIIVLVWPHPCFYCEELVVREHPRFFEPIGITYERKIILIVQILLSIKQDSSLWNCIRLIWIISSWG